MENTDLLQNGVESAEATITGDELFEAYQSGKSIEELQSMFTAHNETEPEVEPEETDTKEVVEETVAEEPKEQKPFRLFQTQEEWQEFFDKSFNKRYSNMKVEMAEKEKALNETNGILAELLGVSKENTLEELRKRKYALEAEREGIADPTQYAALKNAENKLEEYKRAEEERKQEEEAQKVNESVADIRRQGDELTKKISGFNLDKAMEDVAFRQTVFSLHKAGVPDSVEKAFKSCFFDEYMKQFASKKEVVARPKEGATAPKIQTAVKPLNVSAMSGADIRKIEKEILAGRYVDFG